jgi:hypothetical protein
LNPPYCTASMASQLQFQSESSQTQVESILSYVEAFLEQNQDEAAAYQSAVMAEPFIIGSPRSSDRDSDGDSDTTGSLVDFVVSDDYSDSGDESTQVDQPEQCDGEEQTREARSDSEGKSFFR